MPWKEMSILELKGYDIMNSKNELNCKGCPIEYTNLSVKLS